MVRCESLDRQRISSREETGESGIMSGMHPLAVALQKLVLWACMGLNGAH